MPTVLITGGHGGIGLACSKYLASAYRLNLVLAGRSLARMEPVAQELRTSYGVKVTVIELDTSSLASVRSGAARCRTMLADGDIDSLQAIVCNAGVRLSGPTTYSVDGYETTFATNYLGHFLLVALLVDQMAANGRIVFTTSGTHDPDTPDGRMSGGVAARHDAIALANTGKDGTKAVSSGKLYATSKLFMVLDAYELDRRLRRSGSTVASIAYDPGATSGTGFARDMPKPVQWLSGSAPMNWILKRAGITIGSVEFSGKALAMLAADPAYANSSGKYFQSNNGELIERRSSELSYDETRALKLWDDSKTLVGLQANEEAPELR